MSRSKVYGAVVDQKTVTLNYGEDLTLNLQNPNGSQLSCTIEQGSGDISLYKNNDRILKLNQTYFLSTEPGFPTTVILNIGATSADDLWQVYIVAYNDDESQRCEENRFTLQLLPVEEQSSNN